MTQGPRLVIDLPGSVQRSCVLCHSISWFEALAEEATVLPYTCDTCTTNADIGSTCSACNRSIVLPYSELVTMLPHLRCAGCKGIPPGAFARVIYCWSFADGAETPADRCRELATQTRQWPQNCACPSCWQTTFHLCDRHAAEWGHDPDHPPVS